MVVSRPILSVVSVGVRIPGMVGPPFTRRPRRGDVVVRIGVSHIRSDPICRIGPRRPSAWPGRDRQWNAVGLATLSVVAVCIAWRRDPAADVRAEPVVRSYEGSGLGVSAFLSDPAI